MIDAICGMNYLFQMKQKSVTIKYKFNAFGHNFKNMTKEELEAKVAKQLSIINDANDKICSCVNDYIESLPYTRLVILLGILMNGLNPHNAV